MKNFVAANPNLAAIDVHWVGGDVRDSGNAYLAMESSKSVRYHDLSRCCSLETKE